MNGIPQLVYHWSTIILPELLHDHFGVVDPTKVSFYASLLYISYFCGMFLSCFVWPFVVKYVSKRKCLLIGILMYLISATGKTINFLIFCRFITGIFLNENSVGKDLLFEFCKGEYRQIGLSLDSAFALAMSLGGPFIGLVFYRATGNSLALSLVCIASIYLVVGFLFFIFFFLVPYQEKRRNSFARPTGDLEVLRAKEAKKEKAQKDIKKDTLNADEEVDENLPLLDPKKRMRLMTKSTKEVIYWCIHLKSLRNPILIYALSLAVTNCDLLLTILLLQTNWENQGYGLDSSSLSTLWALTIIPAIIIILVSPRFCPSRISYSNFMRVFILTFALGVFLTPLLRDLIPEKDHDSYRYMIYAVVFLKNCSCGRLYAPFIHYHLNDKSNRYIRTLINTVNFIVVTALTIFLVNMIVPFLSIMLFSPQFTRYAPYNKYPLFLILVFIQIILVFLVEEQQNDQVLESVTEA